MCGNVINSGPLIITTCCHLAVAQTIIGGRVSEFDLGRFAEKLLKKRRENRPFGRRRIRSNLAFLRAIGQCGDPVTAAYPQPLANLRVL
jgi:hypothetical protein